MNTFQHVAEITASTPYAPEELHTHVSLETHLKASIKPMMREQIVEKRPVGLARIEEVRTRVKQEPQAAHQHQRERWREI